MTNKELVYSRVPRKGQPSLSATAIGIECRFTKPGCDINTRAADEALQELEGEGLVTRSMRSDGYDRWNKT